MHHDDQPAASGQRRRSYEAPDVIRVVLHSDEVLSYGCKTGSTLSKNTYCSTQTCQAAAS